VGVRLRQAGWRGVRGGKAQVAVARFGRCSVLRSADQLSFPTNLERRWPGTPCAIRVDDPVARPVVTEPGG
jgi:hypothetical protein